MMNKAWNLESFLDSLIIELDKARETLAVKAVNKPLTYAVKDVNLEMQLFPRYDGRKVEFVTAEPGQTGASKIAIQLGSITDQQIRQTTQKPSGKDDVDIEVIEDIDEDTKQSLRKIGVTSVQDLANIEEKNIDLKKVTKQSVNYKKLAGMIQKAKRSQVPPRLQRASLSMSQSGEPRLYLEGKNLCTDDSFQPVAVVNGKLAKVLSGDTDKLALQLSKDQLTFQQDELILALDPYAILRTKLNLKKGEA
jgi:hypothetical protein